MKIMYIVDNNFGQPISQSTAFKHHFMYKKQLSHLIVPYRFGIIWAHIIVCGTLLIFKTSSEIFNYVIKMKHVVVKSFGMVFIFENNQCMHECLPNLTWFLYAFLLKICEVKTFAFFKTSVLTYWNSWGEEFKRPPQCILHTVWTRVFSNVEL